MRTHNVCWINGFYNAAELFFTHMKNTLTRQSLQTFYIFQFITDKSIVSGQFIYIKNMKPDAISQSVI